MSYSAPVCSLTSSSKSTKQAQQILELISSVLFLCLLGVHVRCIDAVFFFLFKVCLFSFCIFSIFFSFYQQQFWFFFSFPLQLFFLLRHLSVYFSLHAPSCVFPFPHSLSFSYFPKSSKSFSDSAHVKSLAFVKGLFFWDAVYRRWKQQILGN